jgi:hypothetical protein
MNSNYKKWDVLGMMFIAVCCMALYAIFLSIKNNAAAYKTTGITPVLSEQYNTDNRKWFDSKLPGNVKVYYGDADGNVADVYKVDDKFVIEINRVYNRTASQEKFSLLHEECHIKVWRDSFVEHDSYFQSCMFDLASRGTFNDLW